MERASTSFKRLEGQRWVSLILDCSESMKDNDMPPNRLIRLMALLPGFINQFFDLNPLSQLQIIETSDGLASVVSPMSGNPDGHIKALRALILSHRSGTRGDSKGSTLYEGAMSIHNSLVCAFKAMNSLPKYGRREVLMILGGLSSMDPSHPVSSLSHAKATRASISTIHLAAEMFICKRLANETGGTLVVPLSENHLIANLDSYALQGPVGASSSSETDSLSSQARLLVMGFPQMDVVQKIEDEFDATSTDAISTHYTCPRCLHCLPADAALPTNCTVCRLMLVKFSQLARSYAHLFPQPSLKLIHLDSPSTCHGCSSLIPLTPESASSSAPATNQAKTVFDFSAHTARVGSASSSMLHTTPPQELCYECEHCTHRFCGPCKEGIVLHLHQCIGCLERESSI